jgi:hypothetical protein
MATELFAEVADVNVDGPVERTELAAEHNAHQHLAGYDAPGVMNQARRNFVLRSRQSERTMADGQTSGGWFEHERTIC